MIKVGITGGIGSGKSIICQIFSKFDVPVYYADLRAKILMDEDPVIREGMISKFGPSIYKNATIDRKQLASIIFTDKNALEYVNRLVHPIVGRDSEKWFLRHQNEPYIIKEAALFFESGTYIEVDFMITVIAPLNLRIKRVKDRDGVSTDQIMKRMENQLGDEDKITKSQFIIQNDEKSSILEQVLTIHQLLRSSPKMNQILVP